MMSLSLDARNKLLARRSALKRLYTENASEDQELRETREPDWPDAAQALESSTVLAHLTDREQRELVEIEGALARIEAGTFGRCEECGGPIGRQRLMALPEARTCMACSSMKARPHP